MSLDHGDNRKSPSPSAARRCAWQPLTPAGAGAFGTASLSRVWLVQCLAAALVGGAVVWFLHQAWLPAVHQAVQQLPDQGRIENQTLNTPLAQPSILVDHPLLGLAVDLPNQRQTPLQSDVQIRFLAREMEVCSHLGCVSFRYPARWVIAFNRPEIEAPLQAWTPFVLAGVGLGVALGTFLAWSLLTALFFFVPLLVARYSDKALTWFGSWKLTGVAWVPGTLIGILGLVFYGLEWIGLIHLGLLILLHIVVAWFYLLLAPLTLPSVAEASQAENPFTPPPPPPANPAAPEADPEGNPFRQASSQKNPFSPPPIRSPLDEEDDFRP